MTGYFTIDGLPPTLVELRAIRDGVTSAERLIVDLATRLHGTFPTAVCCLDEKGAWAADLERRGIRVVALGRTPGFHPSLGRAVARVARDHRADVLHAHHYSPFVYSCVARLFHPSGRVVFTEHGRLSDAGPSPKRRIANRLLAPWAHAVCAVSDDVRQHIVAEGFSASKVAVIYNGIDIGPPPDASARVRVRTRALRVQPSRRRTVRGRIPGTGARARPVPSS